MKLWMFYYIITLQKNPQFEWNDSSDYKSVPVEIDFSCYCGCINVLGSFYLCSLHCSVASASSSLFTMMVCWDGVAVRFLRAGLSWLWRRSMWNFRWPLRLNLRYCTKHTSAFVTVYCHFVVLLHQIQDLWWLKCVTFVHKVCKRTVSRWCGSSCVDAGLSCSWRQNYSLDTCGGEGRNEAPCEPKDRENQSYSVTEILKRVEMLLFHPVKTVFDAVEYLYYCHYFPLWKIFFICFMARDFSIKTNVFKFRFDSPWPRARTWRWNHNQDTWRCLGPSAPSCGSPCRSVRGKTPCRFGRKTSWCSDPESPQKGERPELRCSADRKQRTQSERILDSQCRRIFTCQNKLQLPPPAAGRRQAALT